MKSKSKLEAQHTPTPWQYESGVIIKQGYGIDGNIATIVKADREEKATVPVERDNNLKYIIRAVNSHEELLNAVKDARNYIESLYAYSGREDEDTIKMERRLRAAIAKAEGE